MNNNINSSPNNHIYGNQQPRPRQGRDPLSRMIIQAINMVRSIPNTVWAGLGLITVGLGVGVLAGLQHNPSQNSSNDLVRRGRDISDSSDMPQPLLPQPNDTVAINQTANIDNLGTEANLRAILQTAGHYEDNLDLTLPVGLTFSDEVAEAETLTALFADDGAEINQTEIYNAADNATIWESRLTHSRQINLNASQFETAVGATLMSGLNNSSGRVQMTIDPSTLPGAQEAEVQAQSNAENVAAAFGDDTDISCQQVPEQGIIGSNLNGERVFSAEMNVCQRQVSPQNNPSRQRRDTGAVSENNSPSLNITETQRAELQNLITQIRQENCPDNITLIDGLSSNGIASAMQNFTVSTIQYLCPNTTVIPLTSANTTLAQNFLGLFGLNQLLETVLENPTEGIFIIATPFYQLIDNFDCSSLSTVTSALVELGIPLISIVDDAWTDQIPNVVGDEAPAAGLARTKRTKRAVTEPEEARSHFVAMMVGGLILLVPAIWMLSRKCKASTNKDTCTNQDSEETDPLMAANHSASDSIEMRPLSGETAAAEARPFDITTEDLPFMGEVGEIYTHLNDPENQNEIRQKQKRFAFMTASQEALALAEENAQHTDDTLVQNMDSLSVQDTSHQAPRSLEQRLQDDIEELLNRPLTRSSDHFSTQSLQLTVQGDSSISRPLPHHRSLQSLHLPIQPRENLAGAVSLPSLEQSRISLNLLESPILEDEPIEQANRLDSDSSGLAQAAESPRTPQKPIQFKLDYFGNHTKGIMRRARIEKYYRERGINPEKATEEQQNRARRYAMSQYPHSSTDVNLMHANQSNIKKEGHVRHEKQHIDAHQKPSSSND